MQMAENYVSGVVILQFLYKQEGADERCRASITDIGKKRVASL